MQANWLHSYPAHVPADISAELEQYASLNDVVNEACNRYADRTAYISFGVGMRYNDLATRSRSFAAWLQSLGIQPGDRIALMMPNLLQYPVCVFGALACGAVVVNVNPLYTPAELHHQLRDSGCRVIVVAENFAHTVQLALADTNVQHVVVTKLGDLLGRLRGTLLNVVLCHVKRQVPPFSLPHAVPFRHTILPTHAASFTAPLLTPDTLAFVQYTGGTSGKPKGVQLTHRNLLANLCQAGSWVSACLSPGKERVITALPLYHIFALTANCLTFLRLGATNVLVVNPRDIAAFVRTLKRHPPTAITGVNTLFNALLNAPGIQSVDFSGLKVSLGGGMAVQPTVAQRWKALTGCPIAQAYGLTETAPAVTIMPLDGSDFTGSVGLPLPSTMLSIRDAHNRPVDVNQPGEVCISGPQVTAGYWNRQAEDDALFTEDGLLRSGDIGTMDSNGYLYLLDRKKDLIIVSGFNVYPNEIEAVVTELPEVRDAAAIGVPDERTGEAILLFVMLGNGHLDADHILAHCREKLTRYKIPRRVIFCDDLPRTNVGKVLRRTLRQQYLETKGAITKAPN